MKVRVRHIHENESQRKPGDNILRGKLIGTIATADEVLEDESGNEIRTGRVIVAKARCSPHDMATRRRGRFIALGRLKKALNDDSVTEDRTVEILTRDEFLSLLFSNQILRR